MIGSLPIELRNKTLALPYSYNTVVGVLIKTGTLSHTVTIAANGSTTTESVTFDPVTHHQTTTRQTDSAAPVVTVTLYGRVISQTTPAEKRCNEFDSRGRICGYTSHDPQTDLLRYSHQAELDVSGNPTNQVAHYGALTTTGTKEYDTLGQEIASTDALGHATTNSYDAVGNLIKRSGATYPIRYTYDSMGRMRTLATTRDNSNWDTTQWLYAHTGAVTNKTYADDSAVNYTFTANHQPLRTTWARGTWKENSYNPAGQLESVTYSDDTPDAFYDYSTWGYLTSLSNACASYTIANNSLGIAINVVADIGTHQLSFSKALDSRMRLASLDSDLSQSTIHYNYNSENALSSVSSTAWSIGYLFDGALDSGYVITLANDAAITTLRSRDPHRRGLITGITNLVATTLHSGIEYGYNELGNITTRNNDTFDYNARSEVTGALLGGNNSYDSQHRRVVKSTPTKTNFFLYDGWLPVTEKIIHNDSSVEIREHVWGKDLSGTREGAGGVGGLLATRIDNDWYFPLYDHNGNVTDYINESGITVAHREYDAFGNTIASSGPMVDTFNFWYSTKYLDPETGLYYYGYRFYNPALMRWLNRDPIAEQGGMNLYGFVGNDGENKWDYLGGFPSITWDDADKHDDYSQLAKALL